MSRSNSARNALGAAAFLAAALLAGCSWTGSLFTSDKVQYETAKTRQPLEVPPDLSVGSLLKPALEKVGLKDSEVELALLVIEQELLQRVPFIVDPGTGLVQLSDRTKSVLSEMANSLEAAAVQPQ